MSDSVKNKQLPKWFNGEHYSKGETVTNPFSGEEIYLDGPELSMYDFIKGVEYIFGMQPNVSVDPQIIEDFNKGMEWFRRNYGEAYMVLLD